MGVAPYHHSYKRVRPGSEVEAAKPNPASNLTDQGAEPHPADLVWCIRHAWRLIYYSYRQAAELPLWDGVDDFEILMAGVLARLSRGFEPIAPVRRPPVPPQGRPEDPRDERVYQPSCRVYPDPVIERPQASE